MVDPVRRVLWTITLVHTNHGRGNTWWGDVPFSILVPSSSYCMVFGSSWLQNPNPIIDSENKNRCWLQCPWPLNNSETHCTHIFSNCFILFKIAVHYRNTGLRGIHLGYYYAHWHVLEWGGNRRAWRKSMGTLWEHTKLHTGSKLSSGSKQGPCRCEAAALPNWSDCTLKLASMIEIL